MLWAKAEKARREAQVIAVTIGELQEKKNAAQEHLEPLRAVHIKEWTDLQEEMEAARVDLKQSHE